MRIEKLAKEWALLLLPDYIKKLEEDTKNTKDVLTKNILERRLKEVKRDYERIKNYNI